MTPSILSEIFNRQVGTDFVSVGTMWISNRKFIVENVFCAAALWGLWKLRNSLCFQGSLWIDVRVLIVKVTTMLQNQSSLCPKKKIPDFLDHLDKLKSFATRPHRLPGLVRWMLNGICSLFQPGNGWKIDTADEVKALLTNEVDLERLARERNWISIAGLAEAWEM